MRFPSGNRRPYSCSSACGRRKGTRASTRSKRSGTATPHRKGWPILSSCCTHRKNQGALAFSISTVAWVIGRAIGTGKAQEIAEEDHPGDCHKCRPPVEGDRTARCGYDLSAGREAGQRHLHPAGRERCARLPIRSSRLSVQRCAMCKTVRSPISRVGCHRRPAGKDCSDPGMDLTQIRAHHQRPADALIPA